MSVTRKFTRAERMAIIDLATTDLATVTMKFEFITTTPAMLDLDDEIDWALGIWGFLPDDWESDSAFGGDSEA